VGTILIVDDHLDQAIPLLRLLRRGGHAAACVSDGASALGMLDAPDGAARPSLVLLDAMMPDMDGTEVLRRIRSDPRTASTPVVMYTAISDPSFRDHVMGLGANDYWVKCHVDFDVMQRRMGELLDAIAPATTPVIVAPPFGGPACGA
jgi:two-component system cell cycle response regulator